ncbi:MAG: LexA family transcriptional regulator [Kiritimatiellae bacterium]|nr:LexA family transcriptional regulator [Kiritimatiellia bacterium]
MPRTTDIREKINRLREFHATEKRLPGYKEMLCLFGYRSKNAVFGLLGKLAELGYITKRNGRIAPTGKLIGGIRVLGTVQAGFPSPAEEELLDTLSLDEFLVKRPEATFILKVTGDSMSEAGIHPGDLVLVERGAEPKNNDIVIARVDGEWTMKYFVRDRWGIRLEPANRRYRPIRPKNTLEVAGVVRALIRKYD